MSDETTRPETDEEVEAHGGGQWSGMTEDAEAGESDEDVEAHGGGQWGG
jgi:hypothetical protein